MLFISLREHFRILLEEKSVACERLKGFILQKHLDLWAAEEKRCTYWRAGLELGRGWIDGADDKIRGKRQAACVRACLRSENRWDRCSVSVIEKANVYESSSLSVDTA